MATTIRFEEFLTRIKLHTLLSSNLGASTSIVLAAWAAYCIGLVIYRLYIDPLSSIPGSKLAAATCWYEFYYDVIKHGQYIHKIEEMHKKYGPIIRINPYEVVINDADFYNEVYVAGSTRRTGIWLQNLSGIGVDGSHFLTVSHELHRRRRKPLEPYFSRLGITRIEPNVIEEAKLLTTRFETLKGSKAVVRLDHVFSAFAGDVICRICAESPAQLLTKPDFSSDWYELIQRMARQVPVFLQFPAAVYLARLIPISILLPLFPGASGFNEFRKLAVDHIAEAKAQKLRSDQVEGNANSSIFRHIISMDLPESELSTERLASEAMLLLGAGTATTARALSFISYHVLANPHMKKRLAEELGPLMADYPNNLPRWADLEKLDYLRALIKEGLRLSFGIVRRLPRTAPDVALQYKQYTIPKDTPVGMSSYSLHTDPQVYPEPFKFIPERWLGDIDPRMHRNWVAFSRGSRNCLGINLAHAELNWALAVLFRPGGPDLSIHETDESDVALSVDCIIPLPKRGSRGISVVVN